MSMNNASNASNRDMNGNNEAARKQARTSRNRNRDQESMKTQDELKKMGG